MIAIQALLLLFLGINNASAVVINNNNNNNDNNNNNANNNNNNNNGRMFNRFKRSGLEYENMRKTEILVQTFLSAACGI